MPSCSRSCGLLRPGRVGTAHGRLAAHSRARVGCCRTGIGVLAGPVRRLLLVDKQVSPHGHLANAALDTVTVIDYDSADTTLEELLGLIRGAHRKHDMPFTSIACAQHGAFSRPHVPQKKPSCVHARAACGNFQRGRSSQRWVSVHACACVCVCVCVCGARAGLQAASHEILHVRWHLAVVLTQAACTFASRAGPDEEGLWIWTSDHVIDLGSCDRADAPLNCTGCAPTVCARNVGLFARADAVATGPEGAAAKSDLCV